MKPSDLQRVLTTDVSNRPLRFGVLLLGWSIENHGKRSHLIAGTVNPGGAAWAVCGVSAFGGSVQAKPNQTPCQRCLQSPFFVEAE